MKLSPLRSLVSSVLTVPGNGTSKMRKKRSIYVDCGVVVLLVVLLTAVNQGFIRRHASVRASDSTSAAAPPARPSPAAPALKTLDGYGGSGSRVVPAAGGAPMIPVSFRPLNFALLRGGFTSVDEFFQRVNEDPILHSFYGDCGDRNASMHPLPADVLVFTAFRRGNDIKWAKRPLLVRKGEYVMTFCGKTVLARCGNLVSMAAMQPSEDIPPGLLETPVDAVVPPVSYGSEPVAEAIAPAPVEAPPAAVPPATAALVPHGRRFFFLVPPIYIPGGHSPSPGKPSSFTPTPPSPPPAGTPPSTPPPPGTPPPGTPPPGTPPPSGPPSSPPSGPPSAPPPSGPPGPPSHVSGDEFTDHGAAFTFLFGLMVIGLLKLFNR
jgi:hypothetical protein